MGLLSWIVFGALAGWVASLIAGTDRRQGCLLNIVVGIAGAFVGGILMEFLTGRGIRFQLFDLRSFVVAVIGAVLLLVITGATRRR